MEDDRSIILSLELNNAQALTSIVSLKERIAALKTEQKALNTETSEGKKQYAAYQAQITNLTKEQRSLENSLQATTGTMNFQKGSIAANRAELSKLTAEYKNLAAPTKAQTDKILTLTNTLKGQEEAIGSANRNVGNYTQSILKAGLGNTQFGSALQGASEGFKGLKTGIDGASTGFGGLKTAIAATGIGALLLLFVGLAKAFAGTEEGGEKLEQMFAGVKAVISELVGRVAALANAMIAFAQGDFKGGVEQTSKAFNDLGGSLKNAYTNGSLLARQLQEIEDRQTNQSVSNRKLVNDVELLIKQSKDRTKTEQERLGFLDEAKKKTEEAVKKDLEISAALLERERKLFEIRKRNGDVSADNQFDKTLAAAEIDYLDKVTKADLDIQQIDNKRSAFLQEEKKLKEDARQKDIADRQARQKAEEESLARLKAINDAYNKANIDNVAKSDKSEQDLINARNQRAVTDAQQIIDINKKQLDAILANENLSADQKIQIQKDNNESLKVVIDERTNAEILANAQKYAILAEQAGLNNFDITRLADEQQANEVAILNRSADEKIAIDKRVADNQAKEVARVAEIKRIDNENTLNSSANLAGVLASLAEKGSDEFKALAITQALINTYLGITAGVKLGFPAAIPAVAAAALVGFANVSKIAALKDGAIELQGAGTETSDSIPAMLSKGESVMTAKETRMFKPQLIQMRATARGNKFASGVIGLQDGGFAGRQASVSMQSMNPSTLLKILENMPAPVVTVKDINYAQKRVNVIQTKATL